MATTPQSIPASGVLDLTGFTSVRIEQHVEVLEFFTGFEGANRYDVLDGAGQAIAHAAESTSGAHRVILGGSRLESIALYNAAGEPVLSLKEEFGFPYSTHRVTDAAGNPLFQVRQQFAFFSRKYAIQDGQSPDMTVKGPWFRPWTFMVYEGEQPVGKVTKQFSGIGREIGTDADKFLVEFMDTTSDHLRRLKMLVMGFVIDMKHFEGKGRKSGISFGMGR